MKVGKKINFTQIKDLIAPANQQVNKKYKKNYIISQKYSSIPQPDVTDRAVIYSAFIIQLKVLDKQKSSLISDRPKYFSVTDRDTENLSVDELKKLMEFLQTENKLPLRYKEYLVPNDTERISYESPKMVIGSNRLQQKLQKEINAFHKNGISHYKNFVIIKTKKGSFQNQNIQVTCPSAIETTKERESTHYYNNQSLLSLNVRDVDKENMIFQDRALVQNKTDERRNSSNTRRIKPTTQNERNQQHLEQLIVSETRSCNYFVDQEMNYFNYLKLKRLKIEQQEKIFRNQYRRR